MIYVVAFILLLAVAYLLNASGNGVEVVDKAYAGTPKGGDTVVELKRENNRTIYTENGVEVDLSSMRKFYIDGNSLERAGLADKTIVFTDNKYNVNELGALAGLFIILRIDNDRILKEHPEKQIQLINGYKARLLVSSFSTKMEKDDFEGRMRSILEKDEEVKDIDNCLEHLWEKYVFASRYYNEDHILLVSITYKNGDTKDYSFHSVSFLEGVVRYRDLD